MGNPATWTGIIVLLLSPHISSVCSIRRFALTEIRSLNKLANNLSSQPVMLTRVFDLL
jgi:hypothetical protein